MYGTSINYSMKSTTGELKNNKTLISMKYFNNMCSKVLFLNTSLETCNSKANPFVTSVFWYFIDDILVSVEATQPHTCVLCYHAFI